MRTEYTGEFYVDPVTGESYPIVKSEKGVYYIEIRTAGGELAAQFVPIAYNSVDPSQSTPLAPDTADAAGTTPSLVAGGAAAPSAQDRYGTVGYNQLGAGGYEAVSAPAIPPDPITAADIGGGGSGDYETYYDESTGTYRSRRRSSSYGYSSSSGGSSGGGGYSSGGGAASPAMGFPFADGFGNSAGDPTPVYANGRVHPFFGGSMSAPAAGEGGGGGPANTPFPRSGGGGGAPPAPGGGGGSGGGGGGGGASDAYWAIRNRLVGGLTGQSSAAYDDGSQRAGERQYNRDANQNEREARNQSQFNALLSNPMWATGPFSPGSVGYQVNNALPMGELALLTEGWRGKDRFSQKPNAFSRTLSDLYDSFNSAGGSAPSYDTLMGNLFNAGRNSTLGRMFQQQQPDKPQYSRYGVYQGTKEGAWKPAPAGTQANQLMGMLNAIYQTTLPPHIAAARSQYASQALDRYGADNWERRNPQSVLKYMNDYLGGY